MPNRPTSTPAQFIQGSPVLHVKDPRTSAEYYRDVFGFTFDFAGDDYCVVWRDNSAVHFAKGDAEASGVNLFQWVEDVDALYAEIKAKGADIDSEPVVRPYGIKDFAAKDPNGVKVIFGQDVD